MSTLADTLASHSMPEPNSGCLLWTGPVNTHGYGRLQYEGVQITSNRAAWISAHGEIPRGLIVCHKCDVRSCINPNHLWLGTHAENARDRYLKGRSPAGETHGLCQITAQQAMEIFLSPLPQRKIAALYHVSKTHVAAIKLRKRWASIHGAST
jgi:hypothetical protein